MSYSKGHPIRLVGGRLALDFVNTADWTADGKVAHEKLVSLADLETWLKAVQVNTHNDHELADLVRFRRDLREMLRTGETRTALNEVHKLEFIGASDEAKSAQFPPLKALLAASAISVLCDPKEYGRMKMCPGDDCGWLFIDETKNSRRTWCCMETCGNRAKAARHYARRKDRNVT